MPSPYDKPAQAEIDAELGGAHQALQEATVGLDNGLLRLVVTSSYYAIFHAARAALWWRGKNTKTHKGLALIFDEELIRSGTIEPEYLQILNRSREERQAAEYDVMGYDISPTDAARFQENARRFVRRVHELIETK